MKKLNSLALSAFVLLLSFSLSAFNLKSDNPSDKETVSAEKVYRAAEVMPAPKTGSIRDFYKYISREAEYPTSARERVIEGKVFVGFIVNKDGSVSNVEALNSLGAGLDQEAIRLVKNSPAWKAGMQNGRAVNVQMILPIQFKLNY